MICKTVLIAMISVSAIMLCIDSADAMQLKNPASAESGTLFLAEPTSTGNGSIAYINDGYESSYWYAGDNQPKSNLLAILRQPYMLTGIKFLSWNTGRHAPRDYKVSAINSETGVRTVFADVKGDTTVGPVWVELKTPNPIYADQILMQIDDTQEHEHGALILEFQVFGSYVKQNIKVRDTAVSKKPYLFFDAGKNLVSRSQSLVKLTVSIDDSGNESLLYSKTFDYPGFTPAAIDLSEWDCSIDFQSIGKRFI